MSPGLLPSPARRCQGLSPGTTTQIHRFLVAFQKHFMHVPAEKQITPLLLFETYFERFPLVTPSASSFFYQLHFIPSTGGIIFISQSPTDGHLGCFQSFAKSNSTAMKSSMQTPWISPSIEPKPKGGSLVGSGVYVPIHRGGPPTLGHGLVSSLH